MDDTEYGFYLPLAKLEKAIDQAENLDIIHKALIYLLENAGLKYCSETDSLILGNDEQQKKILVILSSCEENLIGYMKEILKYGYGESLEDTRLDKQRYLFIDNGNRPFLFDVLLSILAGLGLAVAETPERVFHGIRKVKDNFSNKIESISSKYLRDHIERNCLPSGAEEIQELLYRNASKTHDLFRSIPGENYALRLLLGAYLCGDLTLEAMREVIREIKPDYQFADIDAWLKDPDIDGQPIDIPDNYKSPLSEYLANRNLLLIEDLLTEHHWDIVLPALLGAPTREKIKKGKPKKGSIVGQEIGRVRLWHAINARDALERYGNELRKFDIILLDLFSSAKKAESQTHHDAQTLSTLKLSLKELTEKIKAFYFEQTKEGNHVPSSLPQLVVFSVDSNGVTVRTLLKELGAVDYFFKATQGEPHKRAYYASFRNALIKALKDTASHVSGMPYSDKFNKFDDWLRPFFPKHRPIILRLMKHFRFYSAMSIVKVFDNYLDKVMPLADGTSHILYNSTKVPLDRTVFSYLGRANKSGPATLALFSKTDWAKKCIQIVKKNQVEGRPKYTPFKTYDRLIDFLNKELIKGPKKNLCVFLVDDMVLSGGQIKSYLWKLINKDLRERFMKEKESFSIREWKEHCKHFLSEEKDELNGNLIEIHTIGAIGLIKPNEDTLDDRYREVEYLQDALDPDSRKIALPKDYSWVNHDPWESVIKEAIDCHPVHFSGVLKIPLCLNSNHEEPESDKTPCDCEKVIPVYVHIGDFIPNVGMICQKEGIDYLKFRSILEKYAYVTNPRANEYPCDFEPLGWKECGGLFSTYANCPGNTLPIIWGNRENANDPSKEGEVRGGKWEPLFHRFFSPMDEGKKREKDQLYCGKELKCRLRPDLDYDVAWNEPPCKPRDEV